MSIERINTVTLSDAITVDGEAVTEISLRKPTTGELRGLKMTDILQMDVGAFLRLLPRITQPHLTEAQISALDPADFTELASKTMLFS